MSTALLSELLAKPDHHLGELALLAVADPSMVPVLGDACLELDWRHDLVPALLIGVPLDPVPPLAAGLRKRLNWQRARSSSLRFAARQWDVYAGKTPAWARAMLAVLLFGWWPGPMTERDGTRCPWPIVRRNAQAPVRAWRAEQKRIRDELRSRAEARR